MSETYDYSYTEIDSAEISEAWKEKLLLPMIEEIRKALISEEKKRTESAEARRKFAKWYCDDYDKEHDDYLHVWRITQIKEKYGTLRMYSNFETKKIRKIIGKYSALSERTCYFCGEPAEFVSTGYILPYCRKCTKLHKTEQYEPIGRWLEGDE